MTSRPVEPQSTPLVPVVKRQRKKSPAGAGPVAGEGGGQSPRGLAIPTSRQNNASAWALG